MSKSITNDLQLGLSHDKHRLKTEKLEYDGYEVEKHYGEYWTSKQRQANALHEISYRACFKPQLPNYFIKNYSNALDTIYDPFAGRGTTIIEAALNRRNVISNDINPLSTIFTKSRLYIPTIKDVEARLSKIDFDAVPMDENNIDLSMFYHQKTLNEILVLKNYLLDKEHKNAKDELDLWIQMVATNRLTGHSKGFLSVYTLPPNQAVSPSRQKKMNQLRNQTPDYRNLKWVILKKTKQLISQISDRQRDIFDEIRKNAIFLHEPAHMTNNIRSESVNLTVTSPPFLDIVQYENDNWLRCWFNSIDREEITKRITMAKNTKSWSDEMYKVLKELFRITKKHGHLAFEVGEVRNGKVKLDEIILDNGLKAGFICEKIMINEQQFTKTANIWGIKNNTKGTNSNRIVLFKKN